MSYCDGCSRYSENVDWETCLCEECIINNYRVMENFWNSMTHGDFGIAAACYKQAFINVLKEIKEETNGKEKGS